MAPKLRDQPCPRNADFDLELQPIIKKLDVFAVDKQQSRLLAPPSFLLKCIFVCTPQNQVDSFEFKPHSEKFIDTARVKQDETTMILCRLRCLQYRVIASNSSNVLVPSAKLSMAVVGTPLSCNTRRVDSKAQVTNTVKFEGRIGFPA